MLVGSLAVSHAPAHGVLQEACTLLDRSAILGLSTTMLANDSIPERQATMPQGTNISPHCPAFFDEVFTTVLATSMSQELNMHHHLIFPPFGHTTLTSPSR